MNKLSNAQISEVLGEAPGVIRGLVEQVRDLEEKLAAATQRSRVEKIAKEMIRKNISDEPLEVLVDNLEKAASQGKSIELIEQAVEYVAPDMGTKLAQLSNDDQRVSLGSSDLERFITGAVG